MGLEDIKAIGFDLDLTLYVSTDEITKIIRTSIYEVASEQLNISCEQAEAEFERLYSTHDSSNKSLTKMGLDGKAVMAEALDKSSGQVASVLKHDPLLVDLLNDLSENYTLFLITNSPEQVAIAKLLALGIDTNRFEIRLYDESKYKREDGSAFTYVAKQLGVEYNQMAFVGDREKLDIIPANEKGLTSFIVNGKSEAADHELEDIYQLRKYFIPE